MDILALFLIFLTAGTFGGIVGWFSRGHVCSAILVCLIAPAILFAGIAFFGSHREGYPPLLDVIFWDLIPYLFLAVPCIIGGVLMSHIAYRAKQRTKQQSEETISK
jgi:hypothetical protein